MKLEDLVPPVDLCKQIPEGMFADSVLAWDSDYETWFVRPRIEVEPLIAIPAPTLEEIIVAINRIQFMPSSTYCRGKWDVWCEEYHDDPEPRQIFDCDNEVSGATAALKLWLELNKIKEARGEK